MVNDCCLLRRNGLRIIRILTGCATAGSHIILVKTGSIATLSIPDHKEVARGTLRGLIRAADMLVDDFNIAAGKVL